MPSIHSIIPTILLVWSLSSPHQSKHNHYYTCAKPFGTSTASNDNDNDNENPNPSISTTHQQPPTPNETITPPSPSTNPIVDSFFSSPPTPSTTDHLLSEIKTLSSTPSLTNLLLTIRRKLHRHPELMYDESSTSHTITTLLTELQIPHTTGWGHNAHPTLHPGNGGYGIVADIGTGHPPCIILRADMDALPILEKTPNIPSYTSQHPGTMHACGHDGHVTMLLGAATLLKSMEQSIRGTVRLVFQPAEEGGAGAKRMVEEGVVSQYPPAQMAFGLHVWPTLPTGTVASRPGPLLAAAAGFEVLVGGRAGHAAMPHLVVDPIVAGSAVVSALQTVVSRVIAPLEQGVVSVTAFESPVEGSGSFNVIPAAARLRGTVRALDKGVMEVLRGGVERVVKGVVEGLGCNATVEWLPDPYPVTVNDVGLWDGFSRGVGGLVAERAMEGVGGGGEGEGRKRDLVVVEPTMGAEDFSFFGEVVPSTFFLLGQGGDGDDGDGGEEKGEEGDGDGGKVRTDYGLHNERFALDERVLPLGVEMHVNLALRALKKLADDGPIDTWGKTATTAAMK